MPAVPPRLAPALWATALAALAGPAWAGGQPEKVIANLARPGAHYAAAEMLVQFKPGSAPALRQAALDRVGAKVLRRVRGDLHRVSLPPGADLAAAIRALHAHDAVDFAEPNWIYPLAKVSDDTYYVNGALWGMYGPTSPLQQNPYGSQAGQAWDKGHVACKDVVVGVIDTGLQYTHPDLQANHWTNAAEIDGNGIDDDGNGYIDDTHGWNFGDGDNVIFDNPADDHGTHVAGTIGAKGRNGLGVAGVCWKVKMIHARLFGKTGGGTAEMAVKAIDYMTDLKARHHLNLVATNNSYAGDGYSQALKDAIDRAGAADIVFVAAAGNAGRNLDILPQYPAAYTSPNIIAVSALMSSGEVAIYSNFGEKSVDLCAPGHEVMSTVPTDSYASHSGTSMAAPHVTGAVALYAQRHPGLTAKQLKAAVLGSATPTPSCAGRQKTKTGARLNVSSF